MHILKSPPPILHFVNQRTPLHIAASKGRDYTVEHLVQKEAADISIKDKDGVKMSSYTPNIW